MLVDDPGLLIAGIVGALLVLALLGRTRWFR
jgi:hypothetical protein